MAPDDRPRGHQTNRGLRIDGTRWVAETWHRSVLTRQRDLLHVRTRVDVGEAHTLHRVEVIEIGPVLLDTVRGRQRRGMVTKMVLPELARGVAEIAKEDRE